MVGKVSDKVVNENAYSLINQVQNSPKDLMAVYNKLEEIKKELESRSDRNNLLSNGDSNINDYIVDFLEKLRNNFYSFFQPAEYVGNIGDLMGQQLAVTIFLFILRVSILFLFIVFIINIILFFNKDAIINKFLAPRYKWINFYLKYQFFFIKFSLIWKPIFIFAGLILECIGIQFLITHQIPIDQLGVNLESVVDTRVVFDSTSIKDGLSKNL